VHVIGPLEYLLWILTGLLQAAVVVVAVRAKCFLRFFPMNFYMISACVATLGRYSVFRHYGLASAEYRYFFFYSDFLLTICLYFALMWLFYQVFGEMGAGRYVQAGAVVILALTAVVTYWIVSQSPHVMPIKYVVELSRNLYFVGAVLTYLLWGAMLKLHKTRTRLIHIVLALGVYFSAFAANYAFFRVSPHFWISSSMNWIIALWLPLAWGYAFLRIPVAAQLAPAQIAAGRA
jgi:hypothetical protein